MGSRDPENGVRTPEWRSILKWPPAWGYPREAKFICRFPSTQAGHWAPESKFRVFGGFRGVPGGFRDPPSRGGPDPPFRGVPGPVSGGPGGSFRDPPPGGSGPPIPGGFRTGFGGSRDHFSGGPRGVISGPHFMGVPGPLLGGPRGRNLGSRGVISRNGVENFSNDDLRTRKSE